MVSRSSRKPSPPFSVLDRIRILCSGCFGIVGRPLSVPPSPYLMLSPNVKLNLMMLHRSSQEDTNNSNMAHSSPDLIIKSNEPHVGLDNDDDVAFDDDAASAESDDSDSDSDGMFHGLFYLGSKVLTEVELQSPVAETKIIATPIRTPKRSNNSSRASSTRELDFGSSRVCFVDSESCSSSDAIAVVSACQHPTQSMSFPCCKEAKSAMMCLSPSHAQMDHISTVSSFEGSLAKQGEFTPLYKHKGQDFRLDDDIARIPLHKECDRLLDEENLQPLQLSPDVKPFSRSHMLWNDRKAQARVGCSSPECKIVNPSLKHGKSAHAFTCRAAGKYAVVPEGLQAETPVGSLPDGRKSSRGKWKEDDGRRRARSLTDEDFNELRGCIDLGFVFTEDHIPDLCETLPALEVCYAIAHGPISPVCNLEDSNSVSPSSPWKVASPGDQPQQVKARLRHWAQAVACNVRQAR